MQPSQPSRTAEYMAFFRALESARPPSQRLFYDPFAPYFIRPYLRHWVSLSRFSPLARFVNFYTDMRIPGARTSAIARTKIIDDAVIDAVGNRLGQVVILGAGFDCRAYRLPQLAAATIFEVDHPATLALKLNYLSQALPKAPQNIHCVAIDFLQQTLPGVLIPATFDSCRPSVFIWEGVSHYLSSEAVDSVLHFVSGCSFGTRLIFTYVHAGMLDGSVPFKSATRLLRDFARLDEPWTFGLLPERVPEFLRQRGLALDRDLSANEYRSLCYGESARQMPGYEFYHVAIAHVID